MAATGLPFPAARAAVKEYRFRHADGIYRWLSEESKPIPGPAAGPREVAGYFIDITARKLAEQTLRESEQRFRTLIDAVRDIVFTCHSSGTITSLNPAYESATGWPCDGMIGRQLVALVHPDDMAAAGERSAACLRGEVPPPFEARVVTRQGGDLAFEIQLTPQLRDGAVAGLLGVARDITARKRAEQELRASEALSRAVIEHSPIGISVRSRTGRLLAWNRAWQELWAMTDDDIRRDRDTERPELTFDARDNYLRDWLPRVEQVYRTGGTLFIPELKVSKPAFGGDRYIAQYFYAIPGGGGAVERVVVITQDITERRQTLQEITILAQAVKSATECISITDDRDILLFVNDAFCRTYGYDRSELIGRHIGMVLSPQQPREGVADVLQRTREGGWQGELLNRRKDGGDFPVHLSTAVVRDEEGSPVALIGVARDITEQKRAEAQREKLREAMLQSSKLEAMGTMAGGVAHDFNNLLTVIQGGAELLHIKLRSDDPLLADVERIGRAASRAAALTRQLLQFSRRQPLDLAACNATPIAAQAAQQAREKAPAGVRLETRLAEGLWPARAQAAGVAQVLEAMLANALEAAGGGGQVVLATENCELDGPAAAAMPEGRPGRFVRITVSDSGPGIPPQVAD
ncbi:PAS domain S-box protein, partial [bacterium]|nr:PAS domain S-box protein [bacterium]